MEFQLLRDQQQKPDTEVLSDALGKSYAAYESFMELITGKEFNLSPEWRYYNDGKAWLCKMIHKKKTVCWVSVWDGFFKVSFFFTAKTRDGLLALPVDKAIRQQFKHSKPIGKLIPLVVSIKYKKQLKDVISIIQYKMDLK